MEEQKTFEQKVDNLVDANLVLTKKVTEVSDTLTEFMGFVKDNMVVKEDLTNFATKDDLTNFATKDDLTNFATKDDLSNLATKDDVEELRREMHAGFREITGELDDIKASLVRLEKKTQEDDDAMVSEVEKLKKRVYVLEQTIASFKKQNAHV